MEGLPIRTVKKGMLESIDLLKKRVREEERIHFNIVRFSSDFSSLFRQSQLATLKNLEMAEEYIRGIQSMGGTEVLSALEWVYANRLDEIQNHNILFMTDGAVSNTGMLLYCPFLSKL